MFVPRHLFPPIPSPKSGSACSQRSRNVGLMSDTDQETTSSESSAEDLLELHECRESGQSTEALSDDDDNMYVTPKGPEPVGSTGIGADEATAKRLTGHVSWFDMDYGIGCITRDDMQDVVLVQQSAIVQNNPSKYLRGLVYGETVEFDVMHNSPSRLDEASKVTGPGGIPVRGSPLNDTTCHRRFRMRRLVSSRGHKGSHMDAHVSRVVRKVHHCSYCGFPLLRNPHPPGPRGPRDQEVDGDPAAAADHGPSRRSCYIRHPAFPKGPRRSKRLLGDKDTTDPHYGFCSWLCHKTLDYGRSPVGQGLGRDGTLAAYSPPLLSHKSRCHCVPMDEGSKDQQRARDEAAESPHVRPGSCMDNHKPLQKRKLSAASKKHTDHDQTDGSTAAQGTRRWTPDHHKVPPVRRLPPLHKAKAMISRPGSTSSLQVAHQPGATLATGLQSAPRREPGPSYEALSHPRRLNTVPRRRNSASHSERKPGAQHMQGPPDARDPQKKPLPHYKASDPKDLHCSPQVPPPEAQVHNTQDKKDENEKGAEATPAPPWAKPSASKEDPTNPLTQ